MSGKIAQFRFKGYKVLSSSIQIKDDKKLNTDLNIEFSRKHTIDNGDGSFNLELNSKITNKDESISINISTVGFFDFDRELPDRLKETFFQSNAVAILFPYIRAYISTLTSLSGITPITLPTLNLSKIEYSED